MERSAAFKIESRADLTPYYYFALDLRKNFLIRPLEIVPEWTYNMIIILILWRNPWKSSLQQSGKEDRP